MKNQVCKCGSAISGTLENCPGVAYSYAPVKDADGKVTYEHSGETKYYYDGQETVRRKGEVVFVCESGCECLESELQDEPESDEGVL